MTIEFSRVPVDSALVLRSKEMDLEAGWLGRCFGAASNAPMNIAGVVVLLLVLSGLLVLFVRSAVPAGEYWKIIAPLITLVLGYMFGKSTKEH